MGNDRVEEYLREREKRQRKRDTSINATHRNTPGTTVPDGTNEIVNAYLKKRS